MKWILLALLLLFALGAVTVVVRLLRRAGGASSAPGPSTQRKCLRCRGTGWLGQDPERTFTFTGEGFEDRHTPATRCPDCAGTGFVNSPGR